MRTFTEGRGERGKVEKKKKRNGDLRSREGGRVERSNGQGREQWMHRGKSLQLLGVLEAKGSPFPSKEPHVKVTTKSAPQICTALL